MATQTLEEAAKFINDEIVRGVVEDIISVNPVFDMLPFQGYSGQAIICNRESVLGNAGMYSVGQTITHKDPSQYAQIAFTATKLIGDVEMDGLVQVQSESDGVNQLAMELSSKAKQISRMYQQGMANGSGVAPYMHSLHSLCDAEQYTTANAGQAISFELLDELMDLVLAKDGEVDFIMMPRRTLRSYKALLRSLGGTPGEWVRTLPGGRKVITYEGIPIFINDYLSTSETANGAATTGGNLTSVWAGVFDDGSQKIGISGIYPANAPAGIKVKLIGESETKDEQIYRVMAYQNFVNFSRRGLARLTSINN